MPPRCFWFRHPFHTMEQADALMDAKAEGEEPAWKAQAEAAKEAKAKERLDRSENMALAFNTLSLGGDVPIDAIVKQSKLDGLLTKDGKPTKSFTGLLSDLDLKICRDGNVRQVDDAEQWESENPEEPKPAKPKKSELDMAQKLARTRRAILKAAAEDAQGIARIGAVEAILSDVSQNTVRLWVGKCTEYQRDSDGFIRPVEADE